MDWSLVLLSQEIQTVIDRDPEAGGWALAVAPEEYEKAVATLKQYQAENRGWPWQQRLSLPGFVFDWGCLAWLFLVIAFFLLQENAGFEAAGILDSQAVKSGQWWRLFTAVWLHADAAHLATNAVIGLILLGLVLGRLGTGTGLLAACLAGAGGNLLPCFAAATRHQSLGASGLVMGALGLSVVSSWIHWRHHPRRIRLLFGGFSAGALLFVLLGVAPGTDILAHFGGFISGLAIGILFNSFPKLSGAKANLVNGFFFSVLVIIPWWAALRATAK